MYRIRYNVSMKEILFYKTKQGKSPYYEWYKTLDNSIKLRIDKRLQRIIQGNYGDFKSIDENLKEFRFSIGKGYRIYYYQLENTLILFVAGSDKKDQKKVIQQANNYFTEYCERTHYDPNSRTN